MADPLAWTFLVKPDALGCDDADRAEGAARRATAAVEGRLNRRLVVRRHALHVRSVADWARQWPVVHACEPEPVGASPVPLVLASYPVETGCGDDTGERLDLGSYPAGGRLVVYAGYRRSDQDRAALNAGLAALEPAWGTAPLTEAAFARVPVLPAEIAEAALALAEGYLALKAAGLGALDARREERQERAAQVKYRAGWDDEVLRTVDRYAWVG